MRLPQELLDEIIAHLHGDIASLKSCSMTSRVLLPISSTYLLCKITFSRGLKILPDEKLSEFKHALQNSPRLRENIQEVHLAPTLFARRMISRSYEGQECGISPSILGQTLSHLDHLRSVTLRYCRINTPQCDELVRPLPHIRLERIVLGTLHSDSHATSSSLGRILVLFANTEIKRLEVDGQWSDFTSQTPQTRMQLCVSHLVFRELSAGATSPCLDVLRNNLSPQSLTTLDIPLNTADSLVHLDQLVSWASRRIRETSRVTPGPYQGTVLAPRYAVVYWCSRIILTACMVSQTLPLPSTRCKLVPICAPCTSASCYALVAICYRAAERSRSSNIYYHAALDRSGLSTSRYTGVPVVPCHIRILTNPTASRGLKSALRCIDVLSSNLL